MNIFSIHVRLLLEFKRKIATIEEFPFYVFKGIKSRTKVR